MPVAPLPRAARPRGRAGDIAASARSRTAARLLRAAFALTVLGGALWLIRRELEASTFSALLAAFADARPWAILVAVLATAASYGCLAASEGWALALVGRPQSVGRTLLVTFVAYALSNGLGFSLATGGAARLRFYRSWGLSAPQVAAVTLLAGLAVTLSGFVTAGLALIAAPGLPPSAYGLALLLLAPAALWLLPTPRRLPFLPHVELQALKPGLRAGLLAGALADWTLSGLALFVLLPDVAAGAFPGFLAVFVLGSVVSAASGVPGGVGVFEAVVLLLSRRLALPHETLAALLLYRLIYALGPLAITAAGFAVQGLRTLVRRPAPEPSRR